MSKRSRSGLNAKLLPLLAMFSTSRPKQPTKQRLNPKDAAFRAEKDGKKHYPGGLRYLPEAEPIKVVRLPATLGGYQYFFLCPRCGRRCRAMYINYEEFRKKRLIIVTCAKCAGNYGSSQLHKTREAPFYRALRISEKLGVKQELPPFMPMQALYPPGLLAGKSIGEKFIARNLTHSWRSINKLMWKQCGHSWKNCNHSRVYWSKSKQHHANKTTAGAGAATHNNRQARQPLLFYPPSLLTGAGPESRIYSEIPKPGRISEKKTKFTSRQSAPRKIYDQVKGL